MFAVGKGRVEQDRARYLVGHADSECASRFTGYDQIVHCVLVRRDRVLADERTARTPNTQDCAFLLEHVFDIRLCAHEFRTVDILHS